MSEPQKLPESRVRPKPGAPVYLLLLVLVWRIADFLDELISGRVKMSLGEHAIEGSDAFIVQSLIIAILLLAAYYLKKWWTTGEPGQ